MHKFTQMQGTGKPYPGIQVIGILGNHGRLKDYFTA
jgi:hypothetical protein